MLRVRLGPEQWAGLAIGGDLEGCLQGWRQHVVGRWRGAGAKHAIGQGDGALIGGRHGLYDIQRGLEVGRRVAIRRRICWRRRADIVKRRSVDGTEAEVDQHHSGDARFAEKAERFEVRHFFHVVPLGARRCWLTLAIGLLQEVRQSRGNPGGEKNLIDIKRLAVWVLVLVAQWVGILKVGALTHPFFPTHTPIRCGGRFREQTSSHRRSRSGQNRSPLRGRA
ncbi:hypothetical protein D3C78_1172810 [compost metagenome]